MIYGWDPIESFVLALAGEVIWITGSFAMFLHWDYVFIPAADLPSHWQTTYRIVGSMFSYLKYNFGENTARRSMYKAYQYKGISDDEFIELFAEDIGLTHDEFVESWQTWILSICFKI